MELVHLKQELISCSNILTVCMHQIKKNEINRWHLKFRNIVKVKTPYVISVWLSSNAEVLRVNEKITWGFSSYMANANPSVQKYTTDTLQWLLSRARLQEWKWQCLFYLMICRYFMLHWILSRANNPYIYNWSIY